MGISVRVGRRSFLLLLLFLLLSCIPAIPNHFFFLVAHRENGVSGERGQWRAREDGGGGWVGGELIEHLCTRQDSKHLKEKRGNTCGAGVKAYSFPGSEDSKERIQQERGGRRLVARSMRMRFASSLCFCVHEPVFYNSMSSSF